MRWAAWNASVCQDGGKGVTPRTKGEAGMWENPGGSSQVLSGRDMQMGTEPRVSPRERGALSLFKGRGGEVLQHFRGTKPISARRGVSPSNQVLV